MKHIRPDGYYARITVIDLDVLYENGARHLLLDIDNTLRPRGEQDIPDDIFEWLEHSRELGMDVCLVSNNTHEDVYDFARKYDLPIVAKAMKPLPAGYRKALAAINGSIEDTVAIGDQLYTDIWGAHLAGLKGCLVCPSGEKEIFHTRILRYIERLFLIGLKPVKTPEKLESEYEVKK